MQRTGERSAWNATFVFCFFCLFFVFFPGVCVTAHQRPERVATAAPARRIARWPIARPVSRQLDLSPRSKNPSDARLHFNRLRSLFLSNRILPDSFVSHPAALAFSFLLVLTRFSFSLIPPPLYLFCGCPNKCHRVSSGSMVYTICNHVRDSLFYH